MFQIKLSIVLLSIAKIIRVFTFNRGKTIGEVQFAKIAGMSDTAMSRRSILPKHGYLRILNKSITNLRYIQDAFGHNSSKASEIYNKLSKENIENMVSPVDFGG